MTGIYVVHSPTNRPQISQLKECFQEECKDTTWTGKYLRHPSLLWVNSLCHKPPCFNVGVGTNFGMLDALIEAMRGAMIFSLPAPDPELLLSRRFQSRRYGGPRRWLAATPRGDIADGEQFTWGFGVGGWVRGIGKLCFQITWLLHYVTSKFGCNGCSKKIA